jgi:glycosyltransferase involved in cell wall biosynthesis
VSDARRLLVITYHFGPDGPVGGLRWFGLTKYLARLGWQAVVVTAAASRGDTPAISPRIESCPRRRTVIDGVRLVRRLASGRAPGWPSSGAQAVRAPAPPGLLRQLGREVTAWLAFPDDSRGWMFRAALRARSVIRRFQPHVVVSSGPPHSAHLAAGMATIGSPVRWLIDLRDPWGGPLPPIWRSDRILGSRLHRVLSPRLERLAFRVADGVMTTTPQLAEVLAARYPGVPIVCVPNGVDAECLPPPACDRYPGLGIAYTGMLYAGRDVGPVVRALGTFFERHPEAARAGSRLRIAGQAESRHARVLYEAIAAAGMERYVEVLGPLPRAEALNVVARSRLAVVLAQQQELQIPAKLYESVAMGLPTLVVAPAGSATAVEGNRVGAVVRDSDDVEGIAGALEHAWRNGSRQSPPPGVAITYEAIAPLVDRFLRDTRADG